MAAASSSSRSESPLNLSPRPLSNREQQAVVLTKWEQQPEVETSEADALAARLFDEALIAAQISSQEAAHLFGVSESLVRKMRSPNSRERVSFAQMLRLPPAFHIALHRVMNRRFGFGRAALARLLEAAGELGLGMDL